jgi:hypothetical protein
MLVPIQGLGSNIAVSTLKTVPNFGHKHTYLNRPVTTLSYTKTSPLENVGFMDLAVLHANAGGIRGVKPCVGTPGTIRTLRRPPVPAAGAIFVRQGYARHQSKGLASIKELPMNLPLLPLPDSFNGMLNSRLGGPPKG